MNRWFSLANLLTLVWGEDRGFVPKTSHSYGTNTPPLSLLCKCIGEQEGGSLCCGVCGEPREQPGEAGPCCAEASQAGADALSGLWISLTEVRGCVGPGGKWDGSESLKKKRRNWRKGVGHLFTTSPTSLEISSGSTRDANIAWKQSKALWTPPRVSSLAANGPRTATMSCYCFGGWGVANDSMLVWPLKGTNNGTSYAVTSLNLLLETMPEVTVEVVLDSTPMNGNNCKMCLFLLIFTL